MSLGILSINRSPIQALTKDKQFKKPVIEVVENDSSFNSDNCNFHDLSIGEKMDIE